MNFDRLYKTIAAVDGRFRVLDLVFNLVDCRRHRDLFKAGEIVLAFAPILEISLAGMCKT